MKKSVLIIVFFVFTLKSWCSELLLQENKGQFPENVLYKAPLNFGALFIEKNKITFLLHDPQQLGNIIESAHHKDSTHLPELHFNSHAFSIEFLNANLQSKTVGENSVAHYYNYYIGNDPSKWADHVKGYKDLWIRNLYKGIDFHLYGKNDEMKYEFVLQPGANPSDIQMKYTGLENLKLFKNSLQLITSVGNLVDEQPVSYLHKQKNNVIATSYLLNDNVVSFRIGKYSTKDTLILDPIVKFSTFSGSTIDNWGFTATYDNDGNAYAGGIAFGSGYPTVLGSFQTIFGGGTHGLYGTFYGIDISISKFTSDGDSLVYSTYLGGAKQECPHSMVVTNNNELLVFGTTSSVNFPTSATAFDKTFNGGTNAQIDNVLTFEGSDIIVTKFNSDGTALIGSTYFGGTGNDGFNDENETNGLCHNYSDVYRGEVITDAAGNAYIATSTSSSNLPIVSGFQNSFAGGTQDGVVAKFSPDLSTLIWSSYMGGSSNDAVYGLQPNSKGELYITGGTSSNTLPGTTGGYKTSNSGQIDGFVAKISNNGSSLLKTTFLGSNEYDQSYFIQIDTSDKVYVYGQTNGAMPISGGTYNNPNSGQFIQKFSEDLSTLEISTLIGSGSGDINIVPSAFLVNNCGQVYISGWGGGTNSFHGKGSTIGMPVTPDGYQQTTDGSDFYVMVLEKDFAGINYATFFGSAISEEHVDGGTSRFDKNGVIYQGVCAACGRTAFPTTAGAFSSTMNSDNCNMAVFKIDVSQLNSKISPTSTQEVCVSDTVYLYDQSVGAHSIKWILHNGKELFEKNPKVIYDSAGTYLVTLVAYDPTACMGSDTVFTKVKVNGWAYLPITLNDTVVCANQLPISLDGGTFDNYNWSTGETSKNINVSKQGQYILTVVDTNGCQNKDTANVTVLPIPVLNNLKDTAVCINNAPITLNAGNFPNYLWSTGETSAAISVNQSGKYKVTVTGANGCSNSDSANIVINPLPIVVLPSDTSLCFSETPFTIDAGSFTSYLWNTNETSQSISVNQSGKYKVTVSDVNGCENSDSTNVVIFPNPIINSLKDSNICINQAPINLNAGNFSLYSWNTGESSSNISVSSTGEYIVTVTDNNSCSTTDTAYVNVYPLPVVDIQNDTSFCSFNLPIVLNAGNYESFSWNTGENTATKMVNADGFYKVTVIDSNACSNADSVNIGVIYPFEISGLKDTSICFGNPIVFNAAVSNDYQWRNELGEINNFALSFSDTPDSSTSYWITLNDAICPDTTTFFVEVLYAPFDTSYAMELCEYEVGVAPFPVQSDFVYNWNTTVGATVLNDSVYFNPPVSTNYQLAVQGNCGSASVEYDVTIKQVDPIAGPDTLVCEGDTINLFAFGGDSYSWSPPSHFADSTLQFQTLITSGDNIYTVTVTKNGCFETVEVPVLTNANNHQSQNLEYTIHYGDQQIIELPAQFDYTWTPNSYLSCNRCDTTISSTPDDITYYYYYVDDNLCRIRDSVKVNVIFDLFIPNAFTPNGDGLNDIFYAYSKRIKNFEIDIFDRWGENIFHSNDILKGWDGTYMGNPAQMDVYVYKLTYTKVHTNTPIEMLGTVSLVR